MPLNMDKTESWRVFRIMAEFVEGFEELAGVGKAITIFGSARTSPRDPMYHAAEQTARLLSKAGFAVITGGGPGIMEAANKGAFEAGGRSIGLNISLPQEQVANRYQTIGLDFHYFYARKVMFVKYARAFICFPGGYGTLDEFFETVTLIQTLKIAPQPVILFGSDYWAGLIDWIRRRLRSEFIDAEDVDIFRLVDTPAEAVRLVRQSIARPWWRPASRVLQRAATNGQHPHTPLRSSKSTATGEGTRFGKRPVRTTAKHAKPKHKP
ncbi:MAG TPA: TIGR00730 family Rossman fold protein, partial [Tepidisphaeraceae bacterium]|nr:TIGR00730 family Rossman fold protein [Tepidisphaeraceae bacterium]